MHARVQVFVYASCECKAVELWICESRIMEQIKRGTSNAFCRCRVCSAWRGCKCSLTTDLNMIRHFSSQSTMGHYSRAAMMWRGEICFAAIQMSSLKLVQKHSGWLRTSYNARSLQSFYAEFQTKWIANRSDWHNQRRRLTKWGNTCRKSFCLVS